MLLIFQHRSVRVPRSAAVALVLMLAGGCRSRDIPADSAGSATRGKGTISGTVRGAEGANTLADRLVEVVNLDTGERQRTTTSRTGGFSFTVKPAKYRVEVALNGGESLIARPGVIDLNRNAVDSHADFVVGRGRSTRPRHPTYSADTGLGQPIAQGVEPQAVHS
jgi:carboxypeptidase family protein